ncbi:nucleosome assembly protein [Trichomonascus vanleenenianus]|uniref:histone chaperone NAP1 n=1 Tax=Trichomonascus vanleenenianus TaxID=2268995 RepID=UPI003EC9D8FE
MAEPIKNKRLNDLANAPTPQNTPATASSSFGSRVAQQPSVATIDEEEGALGLANNPALLSMIQGKLGTLIGRPSGYIESLPVAVKNRITGLKGVQAEQAKLEAQFQEELLELEKKYAQKYQPLYERRAKIVNGAAEPTEEEVELGKQMESDLNEDEEEEEGARIEELDKEEEEEEEEEEEKLAEDVKGIPEFWLNALRNMISIAEHITERDEEALRYLSDIRMNYLDRPGFQLVFEFAENEFFTNKTLTKTYYYQEETGYGGDFIYDHAEGEDIEWKSADKNLTVRIEKRKQRNKHTKATRTVEKTVPTESFFTFFYPPAPPSEESEDEKEEDVPEDIEHQLELDYTLGEEIKDKLIPRAVDWYTGEALEYENLNDFEEDDFLDEGSDEEDHDDEDDEDDDDEETAGQGGKKEPAECNQS